MPPTQLCRAAAVFALCQAPLAFRRPRLSCNDFATDVTPQLRGPVLNEADTCRQYVVRDLVVSGWDNAPHSIAEQRIFTDGRFFLVRGRPKRGKQKKADYVLRTRDFPIEVAEAKADYRQPGDGLAQAKGYAQKLNINSAQSTNGTGIVKFDFLTGADRVRDFQTHRRRTSAELSAILPSILDRAFRGEL